ncbi:lysylphosphatidylglycerol synthase transmembrane domain-containing protein [Immundisolibacter sp.]|uniref:lysylphosphatidylglycerol synthase transmembrane domain-containing protein n=1 Tax=Immundisolibacter sp. TaxID=1934948 RepID=UPI0026190496|nr:lysylphosphatidylglycerol synthase transmembrane domain-containing protein [Immundisolibacter sp.]MDD3651845.1 lysylphosphatidylglycerol synthase transmembrane domain-containing protein [Immundisolibacter sp.]
MPASITPTVTRPPVAGARRLVVASWLFGVLLLLAVLGVGLRLGEIHEVLALLRRLRLPWLAAALALQAATYVCAAAAWQRVLARLGQPARLAGLVPLSLAKLFTDQAVPSGGMSGNILFVHAMRRRGVGAPAAMAALVVSMIGHYLASLLLAALSGLALAQYGLLHPALTALLLAYGAFAVLLIGVVWAVASGRGLPRWLPGRRSPRVARLLDALARTAPGVLRGRVLLTVAWLQAAIVLLDAATLWVLLWALGQAPAPALVLAAFVCASLVMEMGPVPLGLGTFEATCVSVLGLAGVPLAAALPATVLLRGFTLWLPMLPGLWLTRRELRRPSPGAG